MKISNTTISVLSKIITGDFNISQYRTDENILDFFYDFGIKDISLNSLSRDKYTRENLKILNGTKEIKRILEEVVNPIYDSEERPVSKIAITLDKYLRKDGYKLIVEWRHGRNTFADVVNIYELVDDPIEREKYLSDLESKHYKVEKIHDDAVLSSTINLNSLSHEFIKEQIGKAQSKLSSADYDGAITNVRSMLEAVQEEIIKLQGATIPDHKGDLVKLYKETKKVLSLDSDSNSASDTIKQILSGLNSINSGLAGLSNKASDRHSRKYKPAKHHAKLAIETGFAFCEFLISSHEHQTKNNSSRKKVSDPDTKH